MFCHFCKILVMMSSLTLFNSGCGVYKLYETHLNNKLHRAGMEEKKVELENGAVQFWIGGQGDPLLIIHGFGADARFQWYKQVKSLGKEYTLIVPNLMYFGESTSTQGKYSIEFQVETLMQLMDHLKVDAFHCMGMSYGGLVAFSMASGYPDHVKKLIIIDSPGSVFTEDDMNRFLRSFGKKSAEEVFVPEKPEDLRTLLKIAYRHPPRIPKCILKDVHKHMYSNQIDGKLRLLKALMERNQFPYNEKTIPQETLLIWGRYDPVFPLEIAERLKEKIGGNAQLKIIEDTAHAPNLEEPGKLNRIVLDFLHAADR